MSSVANRIGHGESPAGHALHEGLKHRGGSRSRLQGPRSKRGKLREPGRAAKRDEEHGHWAKNEDLAPPFTEGGGPAPLLWIPTSPHPLTRPFAGFFGDGRSRPPRDHG